MERCWVRDFSRDCFRKDIWIEIVLEIIIVYGPRDCFRNVLKKRWSCIIEIVLEIVLER